MIETNNNLPAAVKSSPPMDAEWERTKRMASMVAGSGIGPDSLGQNAVKFMAIMLKGRELGIGGMQSLEHIVIVKGKPSMSAELMRFLVYRAGHKLRLIELTNESCTYEGIRKDDPDHAYRETFTMEDAKRAGITNQTWNKFPKNMLAARATTNICRLMFADAIMGISYTPDELGGAPHPDDLPAGAEQHVPVSYTPSADELADIATGATTTTPEEAEDVEDVEDAITVSEEELDDPLHLPDPEDESRDLEVADDPEDDPSDIRAAQLAASEAKQDAEPTMDAVRIAEIENLSLQIWGEARAVEGQVMRGVRIEDMNPEAFRPLKAQLEKVVSRKEKAAREARNRGGGDNRDAGETPEEAEAAEGATHPDDAEGVTKGVPVDDMPATRKQKNYLQALLDELVDDPDTDAHERFEQASGIAWDDLTRGQASEWINRLSGSPAITG